MILITVIHDHTFGLVQNIYIFFWLKQKGLSDTLHNETQQI